MPDFSEAEGLSVVFATESTIEISNDLTDTYLLISREQLDGVIGLLGMFRMSAELAGELEDGE